VSKVIKEQYYRQEEQGYMLD
jgi:hypothetical protein